MTKKTDRELAWAYIKGQKAIDAFDRREGIAQKRDFAIDCELERRRDKGRQPSGKSVTGFTVGEFREAAE